MESAVTAVDAAQIPVLKQKIFAYIFPKIMLAEIVTIFLLFFLTLRLTHHIAGPVYRMEKNMTEMAEGNLELRTFFRQRDEFSELAVALNTLADSYVERLKRIQSKIEILMGSDISAEQKRHIMDIQEELKTQPPKEPAFEEDFKAEKPL
jgi:methyl-accepting chemotaxis protein